MRGGFGLNFPVTFASFFILFVEVVSTAVFQEWHLGSLTPLRKGLVRQTAKERVVSGQKHGRLRM